MAVEQGALTFSMKAAADYTAASNEGRIFRITTAGQIILCSTLGQRADGVLANRPVAHSATQEYLLEYFGPTKAKAGAAIANSGVELTTDATGRLIPAIATNFVFAISMNESAVAVDERFPIRIVSPYAKP